jgi:hypothetical protein
LTSELARWVRADEARHVAFAMDHLHAYISADPQVRGRLTRAIETRFEALGHGGGIDESILDALTILSAGSLAPSRIEQGWREVTSLIAEMTEGRRSRLQRLGFTAAEAEVLANQHTRSFM